MLLYSRCNGTYVHTHICGIYVHLYLYVYIVLVYNREPADTHRRCLLPRCARNWDAVWRTEGSSLYAETCARAWGTIHHILHIHEYIHTYERTGPCVHASVSMCSTLLHIIVAYFSGYDLISTLVQVQTFSAILWCISRHTGSTNSSIRTATTTAAAVTHRNGKHKWKHSQTCPLQQWRRGFDHQHKSEYIFVSDYE